MKKNVTVYLCEGMSVEEKTRRLIDVGVKTGERFSLREIDMSAGFSHYENGMVYLIEYQVTLEDFRSGDRSREYNVSFIDWRDSSDELALLGLNLGDSV